MGNIDDEYDENESDIKQIDEYTYVVNGILSIEDLNSHLQLELDECEKYDTLSGFLITLMGYIPNDGEQFDIEYKNILFQIEDVKEKRIQRVKIILTR